MVLISVIAIFVLFYFPEKQRIIIQEQKQNELQEIAKNISLSVEFSIKDEDFTSLRKSIDYVKKASDISYVAIYRMESGNVPSIFEIFPSDARNQIGNRDNFIIGKSDFNTVVLSGYVEIAQKKQIANDLAAKIVRPVYLILLLVFVVSLIFSLFIANTISKPILKLTTLTKEMENGNYLMNIPYSKSKDEIGFLSRGLESLRSSLLISRNQNLELTEGLENQVKIKTNQLQVLLNQLQEAQRIANFGSYTYDLLHNEFESSKEFDSIFGIGLSYYRDLNGFLNLVSEQYRNELTRALQNTIQTGQDMYIEYEAKRNDDKKKLFISGFGKLERDSSGTPIRIFGVVQDISVRKSNEEELKRLSLVAKNTSNGVVITDENYRIIWVNDGLTKISGYTLEELKGKTPSIFQFEKTNLETKERIKKSLIDRKSVKAEILNKGKNGNEYWLDIYIEPIFNDEGNLNGFIAIEIDITDRKNNLELQNSYIQRIEESEKQVKLINENLERQVEEKTKSIRNLATFPEENLNPIFEFSAKTKKIIYSNPASKSLLKKLGLNEKDVWGNLGFEELLTATVKEFHFFNLIYEAKMSQKIGEENIRVYFYDITERKNGEEKLKEFVNKLLQTEEELRSKTVDLEKALENVKLSQAELVNKEKLASLGILVAGIAHEVNTPLGAIQASSDNLYKLFNEELLTVIEKVSHEEFMKAISVFKSIDYRFESNFSEERTRIKTLSTWLSSNFSDLTNTHQLSRTLVSLGLDNNMDALKVLLVEKNYLNVLSLALVFLRTFRSIKVIEDASIKGSTLIKALNSYAHGSTTAEIEKVNIKVNVDNCILILSNKIKKGALVYNNIPADLFLNAVSGELSQIFTNILNNALQASDNKCKIEINYQFKDDFHSISISNDGPKIPDAIIAKIFDPFFTTKLSGEGTGLGLNIVKNILSKLNGTISCTSTEKETVFYINLPV